MTIETDMAAVETAVEGSSHFTGYTVRRGSSEVSGNAVVIRNRSAQIDPYLTGNGAYKVEYTVEVLLVLVAGRTAAAAQDAWLAQQRRLSALVTVAASSWALESFNLPDYMAGGEQSTVGIITYTTIKEETYA